MIESENDHDVIPDNYTLERMTAYIIRQCENFLLIERICETEHKLKEVELKAKELQTIVQMGECKRNNSLEDTDKCIVCLEKERDTVYTPCIHTLYTFVHLL